MGWRNRGIQLLVAGVLAFTPLALIAPAEADQERPVRPTFTIDPVPTPDPRTEVRPQRSPSTTVAQAGLAIPALHSRPGSTHTVHLDFDGFTQGSTGLGSAWTKGPGSTIATGTYTGFSLDGSTDFDQAEIDQITTIWRMVAEKYAPYDVNVTTVDPGAEALRRTDAGDTSYGVKVIITHDTRPVNAICGGGCAGIAWNDVFDGRDQNFGGGMGVYDTLPYATAWVFSSKTFGSAQVTALDAAHEIGHTLGLGHDGGASNPDYYAGHANWVPIMGITNQNAVSQFSKGEYAGANRTEDDLAIISGNGNAGSTGSLTLPDDFATTGSAPTALGAQSSYTVKGIITNAADDDLFSIHRTCTDPLTVTAAGIGAGQALDIRLDILDAGNNVLATADPSSGQVWVGASKAYEPTGMDATASLPSTTAGTEYRIRVDGTGSGNPLNTGYSDYGSIGTYTLQISGCSASGTAPSAPQNVTATPATRATTATVSWSAPASDGGSPVTGYQITGLPGGTKTVGNVLFYDATGLTPGTTYAVAVAAQNVNGASASSAATLLRIQTWEPQAKPGLTASLNGSTATLTWTAPANPGNAQLTGWRVVGTGASPVDQVLSAGTSTTSYPVAVGTTSFRVTGVYTADMAGAVASDARSVTRDPVAPSVPGAPATVTATSAANGRSGTITWTAPSDTGGSAVTGYRLTGLPVGTVVVGNVLGYSATGLAPGRTYTVTVAATAAVGTGAGRAATLRTTSKPSAPRIGAATSGPKKGVKNATARWAAPTSTGGTAVTSYKVVAYKIVKRKVVRSYVSRALPASARAFVFRLPGGTYKFRVVAYNAVGGSPASGYSRLVTSR